MGGGGREANLVAVVIFIVIFIVMFIVIFVVSATDVTVIFKIEKDNFVLYIALSCLAKWYSF